jgi:septal ring factor EnvC (AmiA/AmiB activator)
VFAAVLVVVVAILAIFGNMAARLMPAAVLTGKQTQALDDLHKNQVDADLGRREEETKKLRKEIKKQDTVVEEHDEKLKQIEDSARKEDDRIVNEAGMSVEEINEWRRRQGR